MAFGISCSLLCLQFFRTVTGKRTKESIMYLRFRIRRMRRVQEVFFSSCVINRFPAKCRWKCRLVCPERQIAFHQLNLLVSWSFKGKSCVPPFSWCKAWNERQFQLSCVSRPFLLTLIKTVLEIYDAETNSPTQLALLIAYCSYNLPGVRLIRFWCHSKLQDLLASFRDISFYLLDITVIWSFIIVS